MSLGTKAFVILAISALTLNSIEGKPPKWSDPDDLSRIIGGHDTTIEKHPYMVHLRTSDDKFSCGGSLLTPTCVLTAAHCLDDGAALTVHAGSTKWRDSTEKRLVVAKEIPEDYNNHSGKYAEMDIAVLKLDEPLQGKNIELVELDHRELTNDDNLTLVGWGRQRPSIFAPVAETLQEVVVPVIPQPLCEYIYPGRITDDMFCAGVEGKDSWKGDSGSPVLRNGKQVGIVSWGEYPFKGVYTSLSNAKIQQFLNEAQNKLKCF